MKKKNRLLGILGLALILAFAFAACELIDENADSKEIKRDKEKAPNAFITLDPDTKYQYVRGFGGMDIPWLFGGWEKITITKDDYEKMYNPNGQLGFNIMRIMINPIKGKISGAIDTTPEDQKFVHTTDPVEFLDFITSPAGARPNYIEGVKIVNKHGGYVLASPWTPPKAWKSNNNIVVGILKTEHYDDYAGYLKKFAKEMSDRGGPIYAISIQNEPNYRTGREDYEGCEWTGAQMRDFFKQVGDFTANVPGWGGGKATSRVLIMNGESANTPTVHTEAMNDAESRDVIDLLARHNYGNIQDVNPPAWNDKEMWMTEWNKNSGSVTTYPNDSTWNYVWEFLNDVDLTIRLRKDNAYVWWALKRFYSFLGDGQSGTKNGDILPRGYALSHYAKFAKEKHQIKVDVTGNLAPTSAGNTGAAINTSNVNIMSIDSGRTSTAVRVTAFISESGDEISLVMFSPTNTSGSSGRDLGTVRIDMPNGFIAKDVTAMRSSATVKGKAELPFFGLDEDTGKSYAIVTLPPSEILSVKIIKQ